MAQRVFYLDPEESWQLGTVQGPGPSKRGKATVVVKADSGKDVNALEDGEIYKLNDEGVLKEDRNNLLDLTDLHGGPLLHTVQSRFQKDTIYTFIGHMVLALNPFTFGIPHYQPEKMADYLAPGADALQKNSPLLPHVWSIGRKAYADMVNNTANQTLLVSGESGAGKTEAVKAMLKFLGRLSTERAGDPHGNSDRLQAAIQAASPILEAFGNAKTARNDNSSRFGKFLTLQFGSSGEVVGAKTEIYLLERSRVMTCGAKGRIYHSFHQLLASPDAAKYKLTRAEDYPGAHMNPKVRGVDDAELYAETNRAFELAGITDAERDQVWSVVAGILHLLRTEFKPGSVSDTTEIPASSKEFLANAAEMWGVDKDQLEKELVTSTKMMGREAITKHNKPEISTRNRDTICKEVYQHLFSWLVEKINAKTDCPQHSNVIGLLDIFGFEKFEVNGFEQLSINLANEMLQGHYNDHVFRADMKECQEEGIDVGSFTYEDNTDIVQMLGGSGSSMLRLLDDVCKTKPENDEGFLSRIYDTHGNHRALTSGPLEKAKGLFTIGHFAGEVEYTVAGMGLKNAASLDQGVVDLLKEAKLDLMRNLVKDIDLGKKKTVGAVFREQLSRLIGVINATQPSWVRCIKPNSEKVPKKFEPHMVNEQLKCGGVLATINIRKKGYPIRAPHKDFVGRYKCILDRPTTGDFQKAAVDIVAKAGLAKEQAQVGKTRVFLKSKVYDKLNEDRNAALRVHNIKLLLQCKIEQKTRAAIEHKCKQAWFVAFRIIEEAADRAPAVLMQQYVAALTPIVAEFRQEGERLAAPPVPSVASVPSIAPAPSGRAAIAQTYRPAPRPAVPAAPASTAYFKPYMLFSRGRWPAYEKPRPGMLLRRDGAEITYEPFTVIEAHDTCEELGEGMSDWLEVKGGTWVMRRGLQAHNVEGDDVGKQGWDPLAANAVTGVYGQAPTAWEGATAQHMGDGGISAE